MPNCPECESPVSVGEAFCPMCGIALAVPAVPPVEISAPSELEEDSFDGTIMMEPEELARLAASAKREATVTETPADEVEPHIGTPLAPDDVFRVEDLEKPSVRSDVPPTLSPDSFEDPKPPSFLDEIKDTSGNVDVRSTAEYRSEKAKTLETKQPEESVAAAEIQALVPDTPPPSILESGNEPLATPAEDEPVPEIAKPDFDLPEYQADAPIYDSVRIVATDIPESQDFVSTRIPGSRDLPRPETIQPGRSPSGEARPNTMQNLGMGTSDGRKSSKLKPLSEGAVLNNRYEIIRKIGGGGMGAVYLASDNNLGGVLRAVKEMVQAHIEEDQ